MVPRSERRSRSAGMQSRAHPGAGLPPFDRGEKSAMAAASASLGVSIEVVPEDFIAFAGRFWAGEARLQCSHTATMHLATCAILSREAAVPAHLPDGLR